VNLTSTSNVYKSKIKFALLLTRHNYIEHDVSLSRLDAHFGNNSQFDKNTYSQLDQFVDSEGYLSYDAFPAYRHFREQETKRLNPDRVYGIKQQFAAYFELAILYLTFEEGGRVRKKVLDVFFQEERLPFELGWKPRPVSMVQVASTFTAMRLKAALIK